MRGLTGIGGALVVTIAGLSLGAEVQAQPTPPVDAGPPQVPADAGVGPAPDAAAPAAPSEGGDIVVLHGGGMVRGTIAELVPDERVVIRSITGETRTFAMRDVEFAGEESEWRSSQDADDDDRPSTDDAYGRETDDGDEDDEDDDDRGRARPEVVVRARRVRVALRARDDEVTFYLRESVGGSFTTGAGFEVTSRVTGIRRLCTAPCRVSLAAGRYRFDLARRGSRPREVERSIRLQTDAELTGYFESRSGQRVAGGVILGASFAIAAGVLIGLAEADEVELGATFGIGVLVVGGIVGGGFALRRDVPRIHVED